MHKYCPFGLATVLVAFAAPAIAADYYQCRDAEGTMIYSDIPCTDEGEMIKARVYGDPAADEAVETVSEPEPEPVEEEPVVMVEGALLTAEVRQAMASLRPLREGMLEYHDRTGQWPGEPADAGFDAANLNQSRIERVELGPEGAIIAYLAPRLGVNRRIELDPIPAMGGVDFEWRCVANYPQDVLFDGLRDFCQSGTVVGAPVRPVSSSATIDQNGAPLTASGSPSADEPPDERSATESTQ